MYRDEEGQKMTVSRRLSCQCYMLALTAPSQRPCHCNCCRPPPQLVLATSITVEEEHDFCVPRQPAIHQRSHDQASAASNSEFILTAVRTSYGKSPQNGVSKPS